MPALYLHINLHIDEMKNILVLNGNPKRESFNHAIANSFANGAKVAGHSVQQVWIGDLQFQASLFNGFEANTPLEPDLIKFQEQLAWCDHLFVVYPTWWAGMPAQLKGLWDRTMLPGFAFRYRKDSPLWDKLLKGRTATVITTMDTPLLVDCFLMRRAGLRQLTQGILSFCGIKPIKAITIGSVRRFNEKQREKWIAKVHRLGTKIV